LKALVLAVLLSPLLGIGNINAQELYLNSQNTDEVLRYNGTTGAFMNAFVSMGDGGLNRPTGLVFGPDGNLYVSSDPTNEVLRYNSTTGAFSWMHS